MRLGTDTRLMHSICTFANVHGTFDTKQTLTKCYAATQIESEDITSWSCRFEDILGSAADTGLAQKAAMNEMPKSMLWTGMKPELKDMCGYEFDKINNYDRLRVDLRKLEQEHHTQEKGTKTINKGAAYKDQNETRKELDELRDTMKTMTESMAVMNRQVQYQQVQQTTTSSIKTSTTT